MFKRFLIISASLILFSCSLFDPSVLSISEILATDSFYADSIILQDAGAYSIYLSSDYPLDIFFFDSKSGFDAFKDSGMLYSEYIYYPLSFANETYVDDLFNTFEEGKTLYFVIDNTSKITQSSGNAYYTIEIKKL
ncbi:MAG: hypothetical protein AB7T10_06915 [bacterium]